MNNINFNEDDSIVFDIDTDPHEENRPLYSSRQHIIYPGVTVLVGANGAGKTTLINSMVSVLRSNNIRYLTYSELLDGRDAARSKYGFEDNMSALAQTLMSSEGENVYFNFGNFVAKVGGYITNYNKGELAFSLSVDDTAIDTIPVGNKMVSADTYRFIFVDAIDSGMSIDKIVSTCEFFDKVLIKSNKDLKIYLVLSTNQYEFCRAFPNSCYGVRECDYIKFKDYEDYRNYICNYNEE